ncbi:sigma-70 family RNA polymerase sigma factor [Ruminococcus sp. YE78]|uniref:RNA polymerase sigma factor n=1 Tax=Ruminococcus sp. YE78 TaxID=1352374 RepID=UPI00088990C9|nr:sigma-70 family RNA polymerase sigma factor [Ruminococcus sp. YE78]SDA28065.1 RNA polymerase sigma-70 factor, ECF subfamily [Ruminococcus sp. YE78]
MNDKQLLELLRSDPQRGLAEAVDRYSAYVLKIAYTKLSGVCSREDIEEAVSDIFMAFYTSGQKCGFEIRSVTAFLSVIAERQCLNIFRQKRRQPESVPIYEYEDVLADENGEYSGSELAEALCRLGEPDTSIFVRKFFFGQSSEDIAKEFGMKTNTVNQRISRGLKKLKKILEEGTR